MARLNTQVPQWENAGVNIPSAMLTEGWVVGDRPPAPWFNNFWHLVSSAILEMQDYINTTPRGVDFFELTGGPISYIATSTEAALEAYEDGYSLTIRPNVTSQAEPTINVDNLGALPIHTRDGERLKARDMLAGWLYSVVIENGVAYLLDFKEKMLTPIVVTAETETFTDGFFIATSSRTAGGVTTGQWLPRALTGTYSEEWLIETQHIDGDLFQLATSEHDKVIYIRQLLDNAGTISVVSDWNIIAQDYSRASILYEDVFEVTDTAAGYGLSVTYDNTARTFQINPGHLYTPETTRYGSVDWHTGGEGTNGLIFKSKSQTLSYDSEVIEPGSTASYRYALCMNSFGRVFLINTADTTSAAYGAYQTYTVFAEIECTLTGTAINAVTGITYLFDPPKVRGTLIGLSDALPMMDGDTALAGTSSEISRSDHVHPHDTWAAPYNLTNSEADNIQTFPEYYATTGITIRYNNLTNLMQIDVPNETGTLSNITIPNAYWDYVKEDAGDDGFTVIFVQVGGELVRSIGNSPNIILHMDSQNANDIVTINRYAEGTGISDDFKVYDYSAGAVGSTVNITTRISFDGTVDSGLFYFRVVKGQLTADDIVKMISGGDITDRSLIGVYQELLSKIAIGQGLELGYGYANIILNKDLWEYDAVGNQLILTIENANVIGMPDTDKLFWYRLVEETKENMDAAAAVGFNIQYSPETKVLNAYCTNLTDPAEVIGDIVINIYWHEGGRSGGGAGVTSVIPYDGNPERDNDTPSPGLSDAYARGDHVHPTDTTRAAAASVANLQSQINVIDGKFSGYAPTNHATNSVLYGWGDGTNYGHNRLSDATTASNLNVGLGTAATPAAVAAVNDSAVKITGTQTVGGTKTYSNQQVYSSGLKINGGLELDGPPGSNNSTLNSWIMLRSVTSPRYADIRLRSYRGTITVPHFYVENRNGTAESSEFEVLLDISNSTSTISSTFAPVPSATYDLGTSGNRWREIFSVSALNASSDKRVKHDIDDLDDRYDKFFKLLLPRVFKLNDQGEKINIGFIAQEVEWAAEEAGVDSDQLAFIVKPKDETDIYSLKYAELIALNTRMIQNQQKEIDSLKAENAAMKLKLEKIMTALGLEE